VRTGNHPDFGRVVIDTNGKTSYHLDQDGDNVALHLADAIRLGTPPPVPRNVVSITMDGSTVKLVLKHGVKLHAMRMDGRVVLDILDAADDQPPPANPPPANSPPAKPPTATPPLAKPRPDDIHSETHPRPPVPLMAASPELGGRNVAGAASPPASPPPPPSGPTSSGTMTAERTPVTAEPLPAAAAASQPNQAQSGTNPQVVQSTQPTAPGRDVLPENQGPVGLLARRVKLPPEMDGSAFLVPFDTSTGAAAFRSGDSVYIVFDERRPVDTKALASDPVFSTASVQMLPNGTLFRVPLPPTRSIALTQMPQGWRVAALSIAPKQQPIVATLLDGHLSLAADDPSNVVNIADPNTGATLLVGTQHRPGQALVASRRSTEFILRPTIQGVVIEPLSDQLTLNQVPTGFTLAGGPTGLLLSPLTSATEGEMDAALLTRRFIFSAIPTDALLRRSVNQIDDAAMAPPLARGHKHHLAAESLMALGLAAEAEGLLHMAAEQDPKEAASPDTGGLTAIAALLAGRTEEAGALADPRLDGTDEISLWRAVREAMQDDGSPRAAAVFAVTAPLALQYPDPIRDHILPLIVETMIKGGEIAKAAHLLNERKDDPKLAFARALMKQAEGDTSQALDMLDALATGHDQFDRARASVRAVELRLATHKLTITQAADALDKLVFSWRGDAREIALRERIAELRSQSGAWRVALATLRQAETDFPDQAIPIHQRLKDMFAAMVRDKGEQQMTPIDLVAMVDENADLMADAGNDETIQQALADRLLALDLPERAEPVLDKLMRAAKTDAAKARFGLSLATLQGRDGNDAGASATLDASEGHDLPPGLAENRTILRAGSVARMGDPTAAAALLAPLHTAPATEARAQILENASDWTAAEQAWADCAALTLPPDGTLDEAQTRTVLRLATATARAGDDAALSDLRTKYATRIATGALGDMFRLLTVEPVRTTADIQRSQQEVSLAASLPADLKALQPASAR